MRQIPSRVGAALCGLLAMGAVQAGSQPLPRQGHYGYPPPPGYYPAPPAYIQVQPGRYPYAPPPRAWGHYGRMPVPRPGRAAPAPGPAPQASTAPAQKTPAATAARPVAGRTPAPPESRPPRPTASREPASSTVEAIEVESIPADLSQVSGAERKALFLETVLPLVLMENRAIAEDRERLLALERRLGQGERPDRGDARWLHRLAERYRVSGDPLEEAGVRAELRLRVDVIPADLALAQAANESAWGRSRFAREARNLFGIWTYDEDKGLKPRRREPGKRHLVRVFDSLRDSVRYYLYNLNTHPAYAELRRLRAGLRERHQPLRGEHLAAGLTRYSARGEDYVAELQSLIRDNGLERFNGVQLGLAGTASDGDG